MQAYVGLIMSFGFNFAPVDWALCNGQLLSIANYQALYSLIGTTFGGDGTQTFGLPNLQGRVPVGMGQGLSLPVYTLGQVGGSTQASITVNNLPAHTHLISPPVSNAAATVTTPVSGCYAVDAATVTINTGHGPITVTPTNYTTPNGASGTAGSFPSGPAGSGIPITTQAPYLGVNYCISLLGIYPTRN